MSPIFMLVAGVALAPLPAAQAQTVTDAPTSYELRIYVRGASAPQMATPFSSNAVACNLTAPLTAATVNPTTVVWDDPNNPERVCQWRFNNPGPGPIVALPNGNYDGTVVAINDGGSSPESARAPFERVGPPAARTGVRFTR